MCVCAMCVRVFYQGYFLALRYSYAVFPSSTCRFVCVRGFFLFGSAFSSHTSSDTLLLVLQRRWMLVQEKIFYLCIECWVTVVSPSSCGFCQLFISIVFYVIFHSLRPKPNSLDGFQIATYFLFMVNFYFDLLQKHRRNRSKDAFSAKVVNQRKIRIQIDAPKIKRNEIKQMVSLLMIYRYICMH